MSATISSRRSAHIHLPTWRRGKIYKSVDQKPRYERKYDIIFKNKEGQSGLRGVKKAPLVELEARGEREELTSFIDLKEKSLMLLFIMSGEGCSPCHGAETCHEKQYSGDSSTGRGLLGSTRRSSRPISAREDKGIEIIE